MSKLCSRVCIVCGTSFTTNHPTKKTCGTVCSKKHNRYLKTKWAFEKAREKIPYACNICKQCGAGFMALPGAKYCSSDCSDKHWLQSEKGKKYKAAKDSRYYQRHKEEIKKYVLDRWRNDVNETRKKAAARKSSWRKNPVPECCEKCGSRQNIHRHHPDYSDRDYIVWLCRSCHGKEHSKSA